MNQPTTLTIEDIKAVAQTYMSQADFRVVERAYKVASRAHEGQLRKSGDPYIQHPLHVCYTLAKLRLDPATLAAAFLHDVAEDTSHTVFSVAKQFGIRIAFLVDGVTKLSSLEANRGFFQNLLTKRHRLISKQEQRVESLRKMLLATSKDIRIVLIKLADRLHNMQTLDAMDPDRRYDIAMETLEIYAPLAYRLGIGTLKGDLEDLAFKYVYPKEFQQTMKLLRQEASARERAVLWGKRAILRMLAKEGIKADISTRIKHSYSLYRKLERYDQDISKIYDLVACRIIVETTEECYRVLGLLHKRWEPYESRVKDYIASPKPNGYQSLHTTVRAFGNRPIEVQIRTLAMHQHAEFGIAAHWHYSEQKGRLSYLRRKTVSVPKSELAWINELAKWQRMAASYKDFDSLMKIDFFGDRIFVYTPKGDVIDLPVGSTSIDLAYAIHSDIGHHLYATKVNGKIARLNEPLKSGVTVELVANRKSQPKSDWLEHAKTQNARAHIKRALREITTKKPGS